jgi:hypothetical protein
VKVALPSEAAIDEKNGCPSAVGDERTYLSGQGLSNEFLEKVDRDH